MKLLAAIRWKGLSTGISATSRSISVETQIAKIRGDEEDERKQDDTDVVQEADEETLRPFKEVDLWRTLLIASKSDVAVQMSTVNPNKTKGRPVGQHMPETTPRWRSRIC